MLQVLVVVVAVASRFRSEVLLPFTLLLRQLLLERGALVFLHLRRRVLLVLTERARIKQRG